ncbi:hypothetical protein ZHAS_00009677 [Anopheles sinensis]|uniref:Uncharacterized protein n=1 Tax=Anopheles sinensis TaxID=74873 RepID=A0A084VV43_ANOSI|nr:hypothetical protein ZHAS_00009677 [Anopheles sinensis]
MQKVHALQVWILLGFVSGSLLLCDGENSELAKLVDQTEPLVNQVLIEATVAILVNNYVHYGGKQLYFSWDVSDASLSDT